MQIDSCRFPGERMCYFLRSEKYDEVARLPSGDCQANKSRLVLM